MKRKTNKIKGGRKSTLQKNLEIYDKYRKAITLLGDLTLVKRNVKELVRPTARSIDRIKRVYRQQRIEVHKQDETLELPNVHELARQYDAGYAHEPQSTIDEIPEELSTSSTSIEQIDIYAEAVQDFRDSIYEFCENCIERTPYIHGSAMPQWWVARRDACVQLVDQIIALGREEEFYKKLINSNIYDVLNSVSHSPSDNDAAWDEIENFLTDSLNDVASAW